MGLILGLDPGLAETGYGLIGVSGTRCRHVCHGVIRTSSQASTAERLNTIFEEVNRLIGSHGPTEAAVESLYFSKNITSALPVAQARGVVLLACAHGGLSCHEYTPQAIKQALVGTGRADKTQVQNLVRIVLGLEESPSPDHAADALAAAICHANSSLAALRLASTRRMP